MCFERIRPSSVHVTDKDVPRQVDAPNDHRLNRLEPLVLGGVLMRDKQEFDPDEDDDGSMGKVGGHELPPVRLEISDDGVED